MFYTSNEYQIKGCEITTLTGSNSENKTCWLDTESLREIGDCYRIWLITKGSGLVITTVGEVPLVESKVYFFPESFAVWPICATFA